MTRRATLRRFLRAPPPAFKIVVLVLVTVFYGAAGFLVFERPGRPGLSWQDAWWWAIVTMSTLGYGDLFPVTAAGRFIVGYPIIFVGMGFLALGLTNLASFFFRADSLNRRGLMSANTRDHVIVCNVPSLSRFRRVLAELRGQQGNRPKPVVIVDADLPDISSDLSADDVHYVRGNPALIETLNRAGVAHAASAVVLAKDPTRPESDAGTAAICLAVKTLRRDLHVVAECVEPTNQEVIERTGCDSVVCVMDLAPGLLAQEVTEPGIVEVLHELTIWDDEQNNVYIVSIEQGAGCSVGSLREAAARQDATLLGIRRADNRTLLNPKSSLRLDAHDMAIVMCSSRPPRIAVSKAVLAASV